MDNNEREKSEFVFEGTSVSASPNIVTLAINKTGQLEKITSVVIIDEHQDELALYRKSTSAPEMWSRDIYRFSTRTRLGKDKNKYSLPPILPNGAIEYVIGDIRFSATVRLSEKHLQNLVTKLRELR